MASGQLGYLNWAKSAQAGELLEPRSEKTAHNHVTRLQSTKKPLWVQQIGSMLHTTRSLGKTATTVQRDCLGQAARSACNQSHGICTQNDRRILLNVLHSRGARSHAQNEQHWLFWGPIQRRAVDPQKFGQAGRYKNVSIAPHWFVQHVPCIEPERPSSGRAVGGSIGPRRGRKCSSMLANCAMQVSQ